MQQKTCYEQLKIADEENARQHLSRYTFVELENLNDDSIVFDGIHRFVQLPQNDIAELLVCLSKNDASDGKVIISIKWYSNGDSGVIDMTCPVSKLPIACFQERLDEFMSLRNGSIDYIYGAEELKKLCCRANSIRFEMLLINKIELFPGIANDGVLPRKAFSIGQANDKRYYIDAKKIK